MIKIAREINREGLKMKGIKYCRVAIAEVRFGNIVHANKCLNLGRNREEDQVEYSIPKRTLRIKGVISGWDCGVPIHELVEATDDKERLIQVERMKRRFVDKKIKEVRMRLTSLVILTYEGNVLPESVTLFGGTIRMKVRPFMEPVRQCFGCFQYGHFKKFCKIERKSMVCGKNFHGECTATPRCINCGDKHKANDKQKCVLYEYNYNLKRVMADRNMSIYEARQIVRRPYLKKDVE